MKSALIWALHRFYGVRPLNKKLENSLEEMAKHLRRDLNGEVSTDCASPQNLTRYLQEIGVFNARNFVSLETYDIYDFESDN